MLSHLASSFCFELQTMPYSRFFNSSQRTEYEKNRKFIIKKYDTCAICGKPVDKKLKSPHPLSASVDHIIPLAKGGHPFDIANLQLAHRQCNRLKSDNLPTINVKSDEELNVGSRDLPKSTDWLTYDSKKKIKIKPRK